MNWKSEHRSIISRSRLGSVLIVVLMVISSSFVILVTIEVEGDLAFGSTEISRTYEKTISSSIYKSLGNLGDIDDLSNQKANATYEVQFDEQGRQVVNVTVIDYAEPPSPRITTDECGDGSNQFTTNNGGVRWMEFPVSYAVDPANSGVAPTATTNAFIAAFNHFESHMPGEALLQTTNFDSADIKVRWQFIDGEGGQLGLASWTFIPSTLEITSAAITLDSGDSWFVASSESCGQNGNLFDIQNVGSHELGHVIGLGHVNDNLLTMFPNSFAGETLRRSLGTGDKDGLSFLYGSAQAPLTGVSARQTNNIVGAQSYYDVVFTTSTTGTIKFIDITFPAGTVIGATPLLVEREGIGAGTAAKTSATEIRYTVTSAVSVPAGTKIRLEFFNIVNPTAPNTGYKVTVTTRNTGGTPIDGPTLSNSLNMKQLGSGQIADNSITSTKPAESFMKKVILLDDADGNALGWNPDAFETAFNIAASSVSSFNDGYVSVVIPSECRATAIGQGFFNMICSSAPGINAQLHYVVINLPAQVNE